MFSACTLAGGNGIVSGEGQHHNMTRISADVQSLGTIAESKFKAFDTWMFKECEFGETSQPQVNIDLIERRRTMPIEDAYLFGHQGVRSEVVARGALDVESAHPCLLTTPSNFVGNKRSKSEAVACGPLNVENAHPCSGSMGHKVPGRQFPREDAPPVDKRAYYEQRLQSRAREMQKTWASSQATLKRFLARHKFDDVTTRRSSGSSITYPLHVAAAQNNPTMVQLLMMAGAEPLQLDSDGRTASQVAEMKNKDRSHEGVLALLSGNLDEFRNF